MNHEMDNMNNNQNQPSTGKHGIGGFFKKKGFPKKPQSQESRFFRMVLYFSLGTIGAALLIGIVTFMITLEGNEETMVPDLRGMELANAIIELQDKALYGTVQLRYSNKLSDKGTVLGQDPIPGAVVKAKSEVLLRVSKGAAVEKLDDFVGWNVSELETHLKSLESVYGPLLKLQKPYIRVYDESPSGTILEQKPSPGTELTVLTELELVVSRGPEGQSTEVKDYIDMEWRRALAEIVSAGHPFVFTMTTQEEGDPGTVVSQSPNPESEVPTGTLRQLMIKAPEEVEEDYRFGIIERELPEYPVHVPVQVEIIRTSGEKETLISFSHKGGLLTIPYLEEVDSIMVIQIDGEEVVRHRVQEEESD